MTKLLIAGSLASMIGAAAALAAPSDDSGSTATPASGLQTITIQSHDFTIPAPFAEGHTLNANEASALNQLYAENVRNNTASRIKAAVKAAEEAGTEFSLDADRGEDQGSLRSEIQEYADSYKFGARVARTAEPVDPVQKEAYKIAVELMAGKLAAQKILKKNLAEGVYDTAIKTIMASDKVQKLAIKRVKEREALGADEFDIGSLEQKPEPEAPADATDSAPVDPAPSETDEV